MDEEEVHYAKICEKKDDKYLCRVFLPNGVSLVLSFPEQIIEHHNLKMFEMFKFKWNPGKIDKADIEPLPNAADRYVDNKDIYSMDWLKELGE